MKINKLRKSDLSPIEPKNSLDTLTLEKALEIVKKGGFQVSKIY